METQTRGSVDTLSAARSRLPRDIWGGLQTSRRPFRLMIVLALVLHLPALPTGLSRWLAFLIPGRDLEPEGPQQEFVLPIDVDLLSTPLPEGSGQPAAAAPPSDEPEPDDTDEADEAIPEEPDEDLDSFFDDPAEPTSEEPDQPADPEPTGEPEQAKPPPPPPPPPPKAPPKAPPLPQGTLPDAFAAAGDAATVRAEHPNVNVYLAADALRQRKISRSFSDLLTGIPQWQELIGGTGLDPLQDFDRILISGPQFRDPKWIVIAIRFNISAQKMKQALDKVVERSGPKGQWLDPLTARIGKDGERFVAIVPAKRTMWILPASQKDDLERVREAGAFSRAPAAGIVVDLKEPANAFRRAPFKFPKSISHMRVHFTLADDGGYLVRAEGWDASPREAATNAKFLEEAIDAVDAAKQLEDVEVVPDFVKKWAKKKDLRAVGDTTFEVHGKRIEARAAVTDKQLERIIRFIQADLDQRAERQKKAAAKKKDAKDGLERSARLIDKLEAARAAKKAAEARKAKPAPGNKAQQGQGSGVEPPPPAPAAETPAPDGSAPASP